MTRHPVALFALAAVGALGLALAHPALACDCAAMKKEAKKAEQAGDKVAAGCECGAKQHKDCTCKDACKCHKEKEEKEKPKAGAAVAPKDLLAAGCQCEKGGKNCTCPKGDCHCPNCADAKAKAKGS